MYTDLTTKIIHRENYDLILGYSLFFLAMKSQIHPYSGRKDFLFTSVHNT